LPRIEGKRILFIIAQQNFRDEELTIPKQILDKEGAKTTVASITKEEARGMLGLRVIPDVATSDINPNDFDALVIVGGTGSPKLAEYPEVLNIIKRFDEQGKLIAAICVAPFILARADIIKGKEVTAYPADFVVAEMRRVGATYIKKPVVVDGKLITADGPNSAKEFGESIVKVLS